MLQPDTAATAAATLQGNEIVWSAVLAWMSAKGIEMAKNSKLVPWINTHTEDVNRWTARIIALIAAIGVHVTFDGNAGVLTVTGLTLLGIRDSALEYARQYMFQSIAYSKFVKPQP